MNNCPPKHLSHKAPDGEWGWVIVFGSFMLSVLGDGFSYTCGIFYENFLNVYGESEAITTMFSSTMSGMIYCVGPFASGLINAFGCRKIAILGSVITVLGMIFSIIFDSIYLHILTLGLITGTGLGLMYLAQVMIVTYWFDKRLSFATGIAVCGSGIGISVFALLSEWLIITFSWRGAMLLLSGLLFTSIAFSATFRKVDYMQENGDLKTALKETFNIKIMNNRVFLYFAFVNFITSLVYYSPIIFMKDRILKLGIGDSNDAVRVMVYFGLSNAFGRAVFGYIADKESLNRLMLYSSSVIVYGVAIALSTFAYTYNLMVICYIIYGIGEGAYVCLTSVVMVDLFGVEKVTNAFGIISFIEGIASMIGPPLIGLTVDKSYETAIWICATITIITGILFSFLPFIQTTYGQNNYSHIN